MTQAEQIKEITEKLENGINDLFQSDKYRDYLNTMSKFHNYSFNNNLLISMQKPEATYVAGYDSWKKNFGRQVEKGEKAIKIIAPAPYKKIVERPVLKKDGTPVLKSDGKPLMEKAEKIMPGYRVTSVFDISQTTGPEIPKICKTLNASVEGFSELQDAISHYSAVPIEFTRIDGPANGYYNNETKVITVKEGMSEAQTVKTSIHEVAHSLLHDKDTGLEEAVDLRTKEVEAESVAYTVCKHYGIDTSDYSFGYIAGWSSGKDIKELKASLETIRQTANDMICGIDKYLDEMSLDRSKDIDRDAQNAGIRSNMDVYMNFFSEISR